MSPPDSLVSRDLADLSDSICQKCNQIEKILRCYHIVPSYSNVSVLLKEGTINFHFIAVSHSPSGLECIVLSIREG